MKIMLKGKKISRVRVRKSKCWYSVDKVAAGMEVNH
jgi:hypothetical protein